MDMSYGSRYCRVGHPMCREHQMSPTWPSLSSRIMHWVLTAAAWLTWLVEIAIFRQFELLDH